MKKNKIKNLAINIFSLFFLITFTLLTINITPADAENGNTTLPNLTGAGDTLKTVGTGVGYSTNENTTLEITIGNIINVILSFLGIIFLILVIIGGYQWMTAGGNEETIAKAKKRIINATIGVAIVLMAYAITYFIVYLLSEQTLNPITN